MPEVRIEVSALDQASDVFENIEAAGEQAADNISDSVDDATASVDAHADQVEAAGGAYTDFEDEGTAAVDAVDISWGQLALAAGAAGAAIEALNRSLRQKNLTLARTAMITGNAESELRDLVVSITNVTLSTQDAVDAFEFLAQRGIDNAEAMGFLTLQYDMVADALGSELVPTMEASQRVFRAFGGDIVDVVDNAGALAFAIGTTSLEIQDLGRFGRGVSMELQDLNLSFEDGVAALLALEENSLSARDAIRDFNTAVRMAEGDQSTFLAELGLTEEQLDSYRDLLEENSDWAEIMAERHHELFTPMERIQSLAERLTFHFGPLLDTLSMLAPFLIVLVPSVWALSKAFGFLAGAVGLSTGALLGKVAAIGAVAAGIYLLLDRLDGWIDRIPLLNRISQDFWTDHQQIVYDSLIGSASAIENFLKHHEELARETDQTEGSVRVAVQKMVDNWVQLGQSAEDVNERLRPVLRNMGEEWEEALDQVMASMDDTEWEAQSFSSQVGAMLAEFGEQIFDYLGISVQDAADLAGVSLEELENMMEEAERRSGELESEMNKLNASFENMDQVLEFVNDDMEKAELLARGLGEEYKDLDAEIAAYEDALRSLLSAEDRNLDLIEDVIDKLDELRNRYDSGADGIRNYLQIQDDVNAEIEDHIDLLELQGEETDKFRGSLEHLEMEYELLEQSVIDTRAQIMEMDDNTEHLEHTLGDLEFMLHRKRRALEALRDEYHSLVDVQDDLEKSLARTFTEMDILGDSFNFTEQRIAQLRREIPDLIATQRQLRDSGEITALQYLKNMAVIRELGLELQDLEDRWENVIQPQIRAGEIMEDVDDQVEVLGNRIRIFGDDVDQAAQMQDILTSAINQLLQAGVSPYSEEVQKLQDRLDNWSTDTIRAAGVLDEHGERLEAATALSEAYGDETILLEAEHRSLGQTIEALVPILGAQDARVQELVERYEELEGKISGADAVLRAHNETVDNARAVAGAWEGTSEEAERQTAALEAEQRSLNRTIEMLIPLLGENDEQVQALIARYLELGQKLNETEDEVTGFAAGVENALEQLNATSEDFREEVGVFLVDSFRDAFSTIVDDSESFTDRMSRIFDDFVDMLVDQAIRAMTHWAVTELISFLAGTGGGGGNLFGDLISAAGSILGGNPNSNPHNSMERLSATGNPSAGGENNTNNSTQIVNNYNIRAADAQSFSEMLRRNPDALTQELQNQLVFNGQIRNTIRQFT